MSNNTSKNKKKDSKGILGVVGAIILLNLAASDGGFAVLGILLLILAVGAGIYFVLKSMGKLGDTQGLKKEERAAEVKTYAPRQEQPVRQYYDRDDIYDNTERDKERRIQQLKVFLDNGIIEREEYNILLYRYKNDI